MRWAFLCLLALLLPLSAAAAQQRGTITGTVTDQAGTPLVGAQVVVQNTNLGTITNSQGRYLIPGVAVGPQSVRAILLGFSPVAEQVTVVAGESVTANLRLGIAAVQLDGIVAVGYGTQKRVNLTGAVASVNTEEMSKLTVPTVTHALQGLAPGLQLLDGGHQPGRYATSLLVRGQGTLGRVANRGDAGASRPLVLIDGLEGDMNRLNVNDIESISVLKDAASAAIYGSRAANGVILITTKRGLAAGRPRITYNGYVGMQDITSWPNRVDVVTHMELANVARTNLRNWCLAGPAQPCNPADYPARYSADYIEATKRGTDRVNHPDTDWVDLMFDPAPIQDHSISVSGGSETARYVLSLNSMREDGLMPTTGADRYGVRLNTDFQPWERVSGGVDVAMNRRSDVVPAENWASTFFLIHDTPPTRMGIGPDGQYGMNLFNRNPVAYARESGNEERKFYHGTLTARVNYDLIPGWARLQTLASVGYDNMDWEYYRTDSRLVSSYPSIGHQWGPNRLEHRSSINLQRTLRALVDYGHTFADAHDWTGVVGYEQIHNENEEFRAWREGFFNNDLRRLNLGNADTRGNWGAGSEWALRSVFGRMNYAYRGRYLLEANARYDGSSRFAEGNRYGVFPSVSAGWRISEEPFFNVGFINDLKFRGSWGKLGNQDVPLYSYYSSIAINQPYWFGNQVHSGAAITALANREISWETTTATDVGFDALLLDGRLALGGSIYNRRTEDILLAVPIPGLVGRSAPFQNAGSVENRGWEVELGWRDRIRTFNYGATFHLSDNRNKVLDLAGTGPYVTDERVVMVGAPINSWYGLEATGLFQSEEQIRNSPQPAGFVTRLGDIVFKDQNGDGVINADDRVVIGDPNPRYMFGLNLTGAWRGFDAGAFFQGVGKRDQYLALGLIQGPVWENYTSKWHLDYWTPENPNARHPAYYANENRNYYTTNSWWVLDARFVKLRNIQLGYTLPPNLATDRLGVERMRVNVAGKNMWQWSNMGIELDPEYPWVRADYYPQTKVISIGTELTF
jgi:TonB-linked SusC/RagA family outer membrane protein